VDGMARKYVPIAIMYDFDKTLCTKDMQEYGFIPALGISAATFWREAARLAEEEKMDMILAYMYLMIQMSKDKKKPVQRKNFVSLGRDIEFFPGVESWFDRISAYGRKAGAQIEHYIISSGLKEIIEGSGISRKFKEIYACEFHYNENGVADWPKTVVNYTTKTQFLFRINKGFLDLADNDMLNRYQPEDERPIPFRNMIYIGDGLTDVPCMKLVKVNGGESIAVYQRSGKAKVKELLADNRVNYIEEADYSENGELESLAKSIISKMTAADVLVQAHKRQMKLSLQS
jgi:2-hydroxy-3-keto-5-methylthiopentenyl-1-phosphate phosphatase